MSIKVMVHRRCDRCIRMAEREEDSEDWGEWDTICGPGGCDDLDLCPDCVESFRRWLAYEPGYREEQRG